MDGPPRGPPLDNARNAAPIPPHGQSPNLRLPPPPLLGQTPNLRLPPSPEPPGQGVPGAPLAASVTGSRRGSGTDLPASGTPTRTFNPPAPPASATPSREAFLVGPPPQHAAPPASPTTGPRPQQQPQPPQGTSTAEMVPGVPSQSAKKEYLLAVKAYKQQMGQNILRGKMYIESLPADAVPPDPRFSAQTVAPGMGPGMAPGAECGYNMAMGVRPGQPCGYGRGKTMGGGYDAGRPTGGDYGQPIASERLSGGRSLPAQRSREGFKEFAEMDTALKFAKLAEMGPEVRRLMGMGGRLEDINLPRNCEAPMVQSGSDYGAPPMRAPGSFERPLNAAGGFGRQPMPRYGAPMRLAPDYAGTPDRYDGPLDRYDGPPDRYYGPSDRYYGPPQRYDSPPDRYDAPPDRYYGPSDRYYGPPQRYDSPPDRYDAPPPNARSYRRRAFPGEYSRSVWEDYELPGRAAPKQHSQKRESALLHKIREDIQEHYADDMFQQIPREVAENEMNEKKERRVRGGSLPQSTRSPRGIRDDDGESRRARRFRDDYDVPRKSPPPRRQPSRRRQESSSSTSSSSDGKLRRSRTSRRRKDYSAKRLKSRSKRRSKPVSKRSPSSSSYSSSGGQRRGKGKSAKNESSSSSSSSSSDARREKKKRGGIEFKRSVTGRISTQAQKDLKSIRIHCEAVVKSLSSTRGGNGCPLPNMLGIRSREQASLNRPPSRNIVDVLPTYGIEERSRSQNFGGEIFGGEVATASRGRRRRSLAARWWRTIASPFRNRREVEGYDGGVQRPPSRSLGE